MYALVSICITSELKAHQVTFFDGLTVTGESEDEELFYNFPYHHYKIVTVGNLGKFYIDDIDDCIKNFLRQGIPWEARVAALLKKNSRKNSIVLDIGAHIGTHTMSLSEAVGPNGTVIAFEPQRKIFSELVQNILLNDCRNVLVYRAAVGEREDVVEMQPSYPNNEGATQLGSGGDPVPMMTVDSLHLTNVSLIKIDVENYEDFVIDGALETIMNNRPVIAIEIMGHKASSGPDRSQKINQTKQRIKNLGYKIRHIICDEYIAYPKK